MDYVILQLIILLAVANGAPVLARALFNQSLNYPVDGGKRFIDGRPLLGASKTIRGVSASVLATAAAARLMGFSFAFGAGFGTFAMMGDLLSSFIKRRMGLPPSTRANGFDQVPESLFPMFFASSQMELEMAQMALVVVLFFILEIVSSPLLFKLGIRKQS